MISSYSSNLMDGVLLSALLIPLYPFILLVALLDYLAQLAETCISAL